jgi:hypothetical protein
MKEPQTRAWQSAKVSPWLQAGILGTFFAYTGIFTLLWQRAHGGTLKDAVWGRQVQNATSGPPAVEWLLASAIGTTLLWFTFASTSKLVTDDDKGCVMLMFAGSAIGGLITPVHYFLRR